MGMGDELMAMGEAEALHRATGSRVLIMDRAGRPRWSPVWENHPAITKDPAEPGRVRLVNAPLARPYLKAWAEADGRPLAIYSSWRARDTLGLLRLTAAELDLGRELRAKVGPYVVVEPAIGEGSSPNKDWGFQRYQEVIDRLPRVTFVQLGAGGRALAGVQRVMTATFRDACGVLASADAYLGPEGGLHHAAAALRVAGVVIFGGFISPETTGYPFHANWYVPDEHAPCGRWAVCDACRAALERIRPENVAHSLRRVLGRAEHHPLQGACHAPAR